MTMFEMDIPMSARIGKARRNRRGDRKAHQQCRAMAKRRASTTRSSTTQIAVKDRPQKLLRSILLNDPALSVGGAKRDGGFHALGRKRSLLGGDRSFTCVELSIQIIAFALTTLQRQASFPPFKPARPCLAVFGNARLEIVARIAQCQSTTVAVVLKRGRA